MTKNIITVAIAAGTLLIAASALRAVEQKPVASALSKDAGQCNDCHDGDNPSPTPAPAPSPAK